MAFSYYCGLKSHATTQASHWHFLRNCKTLACGRCVFSTRNTRRSRSRAGQRARRAYRHLGATSAAQRPQTRGNCTAGARNHPAFFVLGAAGTDQRQTPFGSGKSGSVHSSGRVPSRRGLDRNGACLATTSLDGPFAIQSNRDHAERRGISGILTPKTRFSGGPQIEEHPDGDVNPLRRSLLIGTNVGVGTLLSRCSDVRDA